MIKQTLKRADGGLQLSASVLARRRDSDHWQGSQLLICQKGAIYQKGPEDSSVLPRAGSLHLFSFAIVPPSLCGHSAALPRTEELLVPLLTSLQGLRLPVTQIFARSTCSFLLDFNSTIYIRKTVRIIYHKLLWKHDAITAHSN